MGIQIVIYSTDNSGSERTTEPPSNIKKLVDSDEISARAQLLNVSPGAQNWMLVDGLPAEISVVKNGNRLNCFWINRNRTVKHFL